MHERTGEIWALFIAGLLASREAVEAAPVQRKQLLPRVLKSEDNVEYKNRSVAPSSIVDFKGLMLCNRCVFEI